MAAKKNSSKNVSRRRVLKTGSVGLFPSLFVRNDASWTPWDFTSRYARIAHTFGDPNQNPVVLLPMTHTAYDPHQNYGIQNKSFDATTRKIAQPLADLYGVDAVVPEGVRKQWHEKRSRLRRWFWRFPDIDPRLSPGFESAWSNEYATFLYSRLWPIETYDEPFNRSVRTEIADIKNGLVDYIHIQTKMLEPIALSVSQKVPQKTLDRIAAKARTIDQEIVNLVATPRGQEYLRNVTIVREKNAIDAAGSLVAQGYTPLVPMGSVHYHNLRGFCEEQGLAYVGIQPSNFSAVPQFDHPLEAELRTFLTEAIFATSFGEGSFKIELRERFQADKYSRPLPIDMHRVFKI